MRGNSLRLAVLIDGDNVPSDTMETLFAKIATLGEPIIRIVYRGQAISKKWEAAANRHSLAFGRRSPNAKGRNATDIEMVIGAMDILSLANVDGFCLVSSDSDFTSLAIRLRESGKVVYGWGKAAPDCLRNACHEFFPVSPVIPLPETTNVLPFTGSGRDHAVASIRRALERSAGEDGWATLSAVGTELRREIPDFDSRAYGSASLKKLALKAGCFELRQSNKTPQMRAR
jgi:hypothetical protein